MLNYNEYPRIHTDFDIPMIRSGVKLMRYTRHGHYVSETDVMTDRHRVNYGYKLTPNINSFDTAESIQAVMMDPCMEEKWVRIGSNTVLHGQPTAALIPTFDDPSLIIPMKMLLLEPDCEVYVILDNDAEHSTIGVFVQKNGKDFYTPKFPTFVKYHGKSIFSLTYYDYDTPYNQNRPSVLTITIDTLVGMEYYNSNGLYSSGKSIHTQHDLNIALIFNNEQLQNMFEVEYWHNNIRVPNYLVDDGIIDMSNITEADEFTIMMTEEQK